MLTLTCHSLALDLALMTDAENPQAVMRGLEFEFPGDFVLFTFDDFAEEFDQLSTNHTNQMIVVLMIVTMFVARVAIGKFFLAR